VRELRPRKWTRRGQHAGTLRQTRDVAVELHDARAVRAEENFGQPLRDRIGVRCDIRPRPKALRQLGDGDRLRPGRRDLPQHDPGIVARRLRRGGMRLLARRSGVRRGEGETVPGGELRGNRPQAGEARRHQIAGRAEPGMTQQRLPEPSTANEIEVLLAAEPVHAGQRTRDGGCDADVAHHVVFGFADEIEAVIERAGRELVGGAIRVTSPTCEGFSITKTLDKSSPLLASAAMTGKVIKTGTVALSQEGKADTVYYTMILTDVVVASFAQSGRDSAVPVEEVSFLARQLELRYRPLSEKGTPGTEVRATLDCTSSGKI